MKTISKTADDEWREDIWRSYGSREARLPSPIGCSRSPSVLFSTMLVGTLTPVEQWSPSSEDFPWGPDSQWSRFNSTVRWIFQTGRCLWTMKMVKSSIHLAVYSSNDLPSGNRSELPRGSVANQKDNITFVHAVYVVNTMRPANPASSWIGLAEHSHSDRPIDPMSTYHRHRRERLHSPTCADNC